MAGAAGAAAVVVAGGVLLLGGDDAPPPVRAAAPSASAAPSGTAASATAPTTAPTAAPAAAATTAPTPAPTVPTTTAPTASGGGPLRPAVLAATGPDRSPADAGAALQALLSARADATLELLRGEWQGDAAAVARATQALTATSEGLAAVITTWRDAALAEQLSTGLDQQAEASRAYAAAVAAGDGPAADRARAVMGEVSRALGAQLAGVTDGRIAPYVPPQDAGRYRSFVDALQAGDTAAAEEDAEWLRARLGREGEALGASLSGGGPS